ncbi:S26 family signal peptidase [Lachnospiraceae bacterium ZAX-1]
MTVNAKRDNSKKKSNLQFLLVLTTVVASITLMRVFLFDWVSVSGESMLPTLQTGELLLVNKTKYASDGFSGYKWFLQKYQ